MKTIQDNFRTLANLFVVCALAVGVAGCSGEDGAPGAPGSNVGVAALADATSLNFTITSVTIASPPVVKFSVTNQDGVAVAGFADTDLRFNIAKLVPGSPTKWQNYINRSSGGAVQGSQERSRTGYPWGALVDHENGTYTYTFATNITDASATCPAPCTDAEGVALDTSYQPTLTHRVTIQQANSLLPKANATYDFVPGGGAVSTTREIVKTATCNECHNQLAVHGGTRVETKLCVTCHNPGSWVAGTPNTPVDFKVMIHKIHQGEELPSVQAGTPYMVGSADFSTVVFPFSAYRLGDTRACAKCHDGTDSAATNYTVNGNNWKTQPSKAACSSCHDDVYFGVSPDAAKPYQTVSHMTLITNAGGVAVADPADSLCISCHASGQLAGSIEVKHDLPNLLKTEGLNYQFNIVAICGVAVGSNPVCAPGVTPTVKFSVTNPVAGTTYDIQNDAAFKCVAGVGLPASVSILVGWNNTDENNVSSGSDPAQPLTNSVLESYSGGVCSANSKVAANGDGTFTLTFTSKTIPASGVTGSGRAALYGRVTKDVDSDGTKDTVRIKAAYKDFGITDTTPVARRTVVDIAKCDKCHDQVSLHGDSRTNEPGLCVNCHNPNATDVTKRPKTGGIPDATLTLDSKKEEAIDFKRLIHGIHAAAKTDYTGATAYGFRNKGLVIWGYGNSQNDFSGVRFPGILNDCTTCHATKSVNGTTYGTYELVGTWEVPTVSGVLGSTIDTAPSATDAGTLATGLATNADDLNITPTAAVCSSCHDGDVAKSHMTLNGALFSATQATINTGTVLEACAICHGPGRTADLKVVHSIK